MLMRSDEMKIEDLRNPVDIKFRFQRGFNESSIL